MAAERANKERTSKSTKKQDRYREAHFEDLYLDVEEILGGESDDSELEIIDLAVIRVPESECEAFTWSPRNAVEQIFALLLVNMRIATELSLESPTRSPILDLYEPLVKCWRILNRSAESTPHELALRSFTLGWRAQYAVSARALWKLKDQSRSASAIGSSVVKSEAEERNKQIKALAVPIAVRSPKWSNERIARKIINDAKIHGPKWLAARGVDRVKRLIGPEIKEARRRALETKRLHPRPDSQAR